MTLKAPVRIFRMAKMQLCVSYQLKELILGYVIVMWLIPQGIPVKPSFMIKLPLVLFKDF